jgi:hypothetical protein
MGSVQHGVIISGDDAVRRQLTPDHELTIGRGRGCGLRIAHEPEDDHVSRLAATLRVLSDCVLVRNESTSKLLLLRPLSGSERPIEPGAATTSLPHRQFAVVVTGRFGREYLIQVDARGLPAPTRVPVEEIGPDSTPTVVSPPIVLTPAQRRLLAALCEPLLVASGTQAIAATYRQVGLRVGRQPGYVRNVFKQIRERLDSHGVPGLVSRDRQESYEDFRLALAMWAIRSGTITRVDLLDLDRTGSDGADAGIVEADAADQDEGDDGDEPAPQPGSRPDRDVRA